MLRLFTPCLLPLKTGQQVYLREYWQCASHQSPVTDNMVGTVHTIFGAAVGGALGNPSGAAIGGVVSHAGLDVIPHKDLFFKSQMANFLVDASLVLSCLAGFGFCFGWKSPQMIGAVAAVIPDIENALGALGILSKDQRWFPSHRDRNRGGIGHGKSRTYWTQFASLAAGIIGLIFHSVN